MDDTSRIERLLAAQANAVVLFEQVIERALITPGLTEVEASDAIRDLAADLFGVDRFWHKRIVRAGENTLKPYRENPPNRTIGDDDILFLDFGPIFEEWEADLGRTYVLGGDPAKHALCDALPAIWHAGRDYFNSHPDVTGEELYARVVQISKDAGWEFGGSIAGHLVGRFPHEELDGETESDIAPGNTSKMRRLDAAGQPCHWILEVHLVDRDRKIGGFVEELLDIGVPALALL